MVASKKFLLTLFMVYGSTSSTTSAAPSSLVGTNSLRSNIQLTTEIDTLGNKNNNNHRNLQVTGLYGRAWLAPNNIRNGRNSQIQEGVSIAQLAKENYFTEQDIQGSTIMYREYQKVQQQQNHDEWYAAHPPQP